jgi:hypothetical protein
MNKIKFALFLLLVFVSTTYSQETVGEVRLMGQLNIGLYQYQDYFNFIYKDEKFTQVVDFKNFNLKPEEKNSFYDLLVAENEKNSVANIKLQSGDDLIITYKKSYVILSHINKAGIIGLCTMTQRHIKKVFGIEK